MFLRIGAGGGGEEDARIGAESLKLKKEPAEEECDIAAEKSAVLVHLVDHHVAEAGQERLPLSPPGEERHVEVLGIGQQDLGRGLTHRVAVFAGGVAVVRPGFDADRLTQLAQLLALVEGEGFHRIDHQRVGASVLK